MSNVADNMMLLFTVIGCFTLLDAIRSYIPSARYDDFKVYRLNIKDEPQVKELQKLAYDFPIYILNEFRRPGHAFDVVIDPENQRKLENQLLFLDFDFNCIIEDLQSILEEEVRLYWNTPETTQHHSDFKVTQLQMNWTDYQRLPIIYNWMDELVEQYPHLITSYVIGHSYEGRPIKAIKISSKPGNKAIFIESNIHAIEWISSATTSCFIHNLTTSSNGDMKFLLEKYDWIYVPVLNPDGFAYSHDVERLWRKNRKPTGFSNSSGPCYGVDMNRNFGYKWGVNAYNYDVPCDHWYAGSKSDTEPEVLALQNFVNSFKDGYICMYLAFHSYGNYLLLPYGHTTEEFPPNYDQMMTIAAAFADAAKVKYGTEFKYAASGVLNYPVSGSSKDWAYGVKNIPFAATIELRDKGHYGFFLPRNQILEVCDEASAGIKDMIKKAEATYLFH